MLLPLVLLSLLTVARGVLVKHDTSFVPDYVLVATEKNLNIACNSRPSIVLNGTAPGPTLKFTEGKTSWVRVYNHVKGQNLTIHWHGLTMRTAPFSDGTPMVAQWPIPSGHFFDYEIHPAVGDAGTYFYHSHVGFQQVSAYGALIVKDTTPPYSYFGEKVLTVANYFTKTDAEAIAGLTGSPMVWPGEAKSILVNGQSGEASIVRNASSSCAPHIIEVEPGHIYRLRVIGANALPIVKMGIEGHRNLTVIEADGAYTLPVTIDHIQVAPGQRFSYLLSTKSAAELHKLNQTDFWIRYESRDRSANTTGYALLRYKLAGRTVPSTLKLPAVSPVTLPTTTYNYLEYALQPFKSATRATFPKLHEVTRTVYLKLRLNGTFADGHPNSYIQWATNNHVWNEGSHEFSTPYLIDYYTSGQVTNYTLALEKGGYDPSSQTYPAQVGEVLDIVWLNEGGDNGLYDSHPMHIHGEHVWDLGSGNGTYHPLVNEKKFANFVPAKRDTTLLYRYTPSGVPGVVLGWRAWRIRITEQNVGTWMAHCHIAHHVAQGMSTIWVFGNKKQILKKFPAPPYIEGYLTFGGSAYGKEGVDPLVNHYFDN